MATRNLLITLLVYLAATHFQIVKPDALLDFLKLKVSNYTTWLKANRFDPSPYASGPLHFRAANNVTNLDCTFSNHGIRGHSKEIDFSHMNIEQGWFATNFNTTGGVTFYGDYNCSGTVASNRPLEGQGMWYISIPFVYIQAYRILYRVGQDGYMVLQYSLSDIYLHSVREADRDVHFQNLLEQDAAAGNEVLIKRAIYLGFYQYLHDSRTTAELPLRALYFKYWEEIFAEAPYDDLVGTTTTPSTPPPPTTRDPCEFSRNNFGEDIFQGEHMALVNRTVEQNVVEDVGGRRRVITKTVTVTEAFLDE